MPLSHVPSSVSCCSKPIHADQVGRWGRWGWGQLKETRSDEGLAGGHWGWLIPDYSHGEDDGKNVDDAGKKKRRQDACAQEVRQAGNLFIKIYFGQH